MGFLSWKPLRRQLVESFLLSRCPRAWLGRGVLGGRGSRTGRIFACMI